MSRTCLTRFIAGRVGGSGADCLCFGEPVRLQKGPGCRGVYHFQPGQRFAFVRWRRYPQDRHHRVLAVVEALPANCGGRTLPGVHPGVTIHALVDQHGPAGQEGAVDQMLDLIEEIKVQAKNPADFPGSYWADAAQRILLDQRPLLPLLARG